MLNRKFFNQYHLLLMKLINESDWNLKEKEYRKTKLNNLFRKMLNKEKIDNHYISLAHEIKSYEFLKNFGDIQTALDSKNEKGPDFTLGKYKIECVSCSPGQIINELEKYRLNEYRKSAVFDYNKILELVLPRITLSLNEKSKKFKEYLNSKMIKEDEKCIIFISLGELSKDFFSSKYGFDLLNVLIGKGYLTIRIDKNTGKYINTFYSHVDSVKKHNGSEIDANFFINENNKHISGIIFTGASIDELYNFQNTFLFLNPYSKNKIKLKDFYNIVYWNANNNMEYIPRYKGQNYWYKFKNKFM